MVRELSYKQRIAGSTPARPNMSVEPEFTIKQLTNTCSACPSQWSGITECGRSVSIHFRHNHLSVEVSDVEIFSDNLNKYEDGCMSDEEMTMRLRHLLKFKEDCFENQRPIS